MTLASEGRPHFYDLYVAGSHRLPSDAKDNFILDKQPYVSPYNVGTKSVTKL